MSGPVAHAEDEEKTSDPTVEEGHASVESQIFSERNELSVVTDGDGARKSIELGSHEGARKSIELGAHEGARKSIELGSHEGARKSVELGAHEAPRKSIELGAHKIGEKLLPNGDLYVGSFRGSLPHGSGKYLWADGCMYEGDWGRGKKCGRGRMSWPSGATYEGDFQGGYIQGVGTFVGMDGLTYKGDWSLNEKHGLGRKRYSNGDVYEGSWNHGVPEGPGRYVWQIGNVYMGDWRGGKMSGRGIMTWASGDSFDGNWLNGMADGSGFYTWADGSCYIGTWSKGLKDGNGTFYPAGSKGPPLRRLHHGSMSVEDQMVNLVHQNVNHDSARLSHSYSLNLGRFSFRRHRSSGSSERLLTDEYLKTSENTPSRNVALQRRWSLEGAMENVLGQDKPWNADQPVIDEETEMNDVSVPVLEREYMQGVLISELVKDDSFSLSKISRRRQRKQAKEIKKPGETIIKGHRSYDLMLNLQLGIRYTVGKITPIPRREVRSSDFGPRARIWMKFPRGGSQLTPPHQSVDFKWKDYCPMVFRNLREMFKIDAADYMMSICGSAALRELSSPGKSGSVFYLSQDDRFMIKTLRKSEVQVLLRMLPSYHHHVHMHENTLITKFFGLHRIKPAGGQKVRFVVMGNMFCTELRIHRRFDLKGSSQGRSTDKFEIDVNTTLKDLDLDYVFRLEPSWREALLKQIELDCRFLESQQIMDYSLLLGLHFRAPQYLKSYLSGCHNASVSTSIEEDMANYPQGLVLVARDPDQDGVILGSHVRGTPLRASAVDDKEVDLLLPGTARLRVQLGVNMPARADHKPRKDKDQSSVQLFDEAYDVVLYLGIIDILQEYNLAKKIEHAYKSFQFDSTSISAVEPKLYSQRFLDFIQKVFPANSNSIEAES